MNLQAEFTVIDIKTTGDNPSTDTVLTVEAATFKNGELQSGKLLYATSWLEFKEEISTLLSERQLVFYFPDFDVPFISHHFGFDVATVPFVDLYSTAKVVKPGLANYKLKSVCDAVGISFQEKVGVLRARTIGKLALVLNGMKRK
jgi:DNA polymerase III epsilon subunit-like protein